MNEKKEISKYGREYLDNVVFDLIYFLNEKMDSEEDKETWYSELNYPGLTFLGKLYDEDQVIWFSGARCDAQINLLDNNKLLLINSEGPDYDFNLGTYFGFALLSNASNYVLKTTKNEKNEITFELDDRNGNVFKYSECCSYYPKKFPKKTPITELLRPISFEQIYERGHIESEKKEEKQRKLIKTKK